MTNAIVMDVDQVLLDYASRLREYVNARDGKSITGHSLSWDLTEWLQLDSPESTLATLTEFSQSYEFGTLDSLPGADVVLHNLMRKGYRLIALTASGTNELAVALRKVNLFHRFGDIFDEVHFVEFTESKAEKLKDIATRFNICAFIDDKPSNILDGVGVGIGNVILMKSPHNREFRVDCPTGVNHAFSWYECEHLIKTQGSK